MMLSKKILREVQAFTIMEVTISMIVASVVIMISYSIYNIISKSYIDFSTKNEKMAVIMQLDQLLKRDFSQAQLLTAIPGGLQIKKDNKEVLYLFDREGIIRKAGIVDTFKVDLAERNFAFEGIPVHISANYSDEVPRQNQIIDELNLVLNYQQETVSYSYLKLYSSSNLIEINAHAFH